ncbi:MAG: DinB family protein [Bacteroidia bacterium]
MKKSEIKIMPEYFDRYINLVEDIDMLAALEKYGINYLKAEIPKFEQLGDKIYAPNKWTINDILQHVIDIERIFCYRALRFARHDETPLPGMDENLYASNAIATERKLEDLEAEFNFTRQSSISLFKSFNNEMLKSSGTASNKQISVLALGFMLSGHFIHHFNVIKERYYPLIG